MLLRFLTVLKVFMVDWIFELLSEDLAKDDIMIVFYVGYKFLSLVCNYCI